VVLTFLSESYTVGLIESRVSVSSEDVVNFHVEVHLITFRCTKLYDREPFYHRRTKFFRIQYQ
jgi:hypothetical protein